MAVKRNENTASVDIPVSRFARRVQSVIWNDNSGKYIDRRRNFVATYIFDAGFPSREACIKKIEDFGFSKDQFVYICFCGNWYAINMSQLPTT